MKRRAFLKGISLLPVAAVLPSLPSLPLEASLPSSVDLFVDGKKIAGQLPGNISSLELSQELVDITNKSSSFQEFLEGAGRQTLSLSFDLYRGAEELQSNLRKVMLSGKTQKYTLDSNGSVFSFDAIMSSWGESVPADGEIKESVTFEIAGPILDLEFFESMNKGSDVAFLQVMT